jgi:hypothetical protein
MFCFKKKRQELVINKEEIWKAGFNHDRQRSGSNLGTSCEEHSFRIKILTLLWVDPCTLKRE